MACKTPVIATDVGGNPYLIAEGETGFLVPLNDPWSLANKISFVLENPDLVQQVTERAANELRKYNKDRIGELYKSVVNNLIKNLDNVAEARPKEYSSRIMPNCRLLS